MTKPVPKPQHKRRAPKRSARNSFSNATRQKIYERDEGKCQMCGGIGTEIHHCMPRSRQGRGVYTNGLLLCSSCHRRIHDDNELLDHWIDVYMDRYGYGFWKDEHDLEREKLNEVRKRETIKPNPQQN